MSNINEQTLGSAADALIEQIEGLVGESSVIDEDLLKGEVFKNLKKLVAREKRRSLRAQQQADKRKKATSRN